MEQLIKMCSRAHISDRTTFSSKINLLRAMRVPEKICVACKNLNDLRNKFAHASETTIENSQAHCDRYLASGESLIPIVRTAQGTIEIKSTGEVHSYDYANASQADKLVLASSWRSSLFGALPKLYDFRDPPMIASLQNFAPE